MEMLIPMLIKIYLMDGHIKAHLNLEILQFGTVANGVMSQLLPTLMVVCFIMSILMETIIIGTMALATDITLQRKQEDRKATVLQLHLFARIFYPQRILWMSTVGLTEVIPAHWAASELLTYI